MRDKEFMSKLMKLALPIAFQQFMLAAVAAADAFMLGSVEQNMMAAVSLATQIQFVQNIILAAAIGSTVVLGAQYWGKRDMKTMDDIFNLSLRVCGILSILFCIGCTCVPHILMQFYTNEPVLIAIGCQYLRIAGFSYLLTGISQCYLAMMKVTDHIPTVATISTSVVLINIGINAVFIFGFHMGVQGAARATLIARIIEIVFVICISNRDGYIQLKPAGLFRFNKLLTIDYAKVMAPMLGACLLWGVGFSTYTSFMGHLGTDAAAANSVTSVVRDLVCCAGDGLSNGCGILVGNALGAGNLVLGKLYGKRMLGISFVVGVICTGIMLALTPVVLHTVKLTPEAQRLLVLMMVVMAVYMIGRVVNTIIINGVFAAGGDTMFDFYSLAVVMWGIAIPLAALGTYKYHWPIIIVYACTCLDEVGKIPWVVFHFRKYKWVKDLTR